MCGWVCSVCVCVCVFVEKLSPLGCRNLISQVSLGPAGYPSLSLNPGYGSLNSYPGTGYPTYNQGGYSCLAPYPSTTFSGVGPPYQDPLSVAGYGMGLSPSGTTIASPDSSSIKSEVR